jgi:hypothetical protein
MKRYAESFKAIASNDVEEGSDKDSEQICHCSDISLQGRCLDAQGGTVLASAVAFLVDALKEM